MSGKKLQGQKRQEVISKWLNGEDDPDWEVNPTKTPGKFIIRQRQQPEPEPEHEPEHEVEAEGEDQEQGQGQEQEPVPPPKPERKPVKPPSKPAPAAPKPQKVFGDELAVEILNELKRMGEEKRAKEAKRQLKKEVKRQVSKKIPSSPASPEPVQEEPVEEEFNVLDYLPPPLPQRKRVQLIK
jgi:hypothetical protein